MTITMAHILLFALFSLQCTVGICIVQKNVSILEGIFSWENGFNQPGCDLFGKEFMSNIDLRDIRIQNWSDRRDGMRTSKEYWIGAHVQYSKWIGLRGCYFVEVERYIIGNTNVRECIQFCNGSKFGLTSGRCVCFDNSEEQKENDYCIAAKCPNNGDEFCGNTIFGPRSCVCVYEILDLRSDTDVGNCKTVMRRRQNEVLQSVDCSEQHTFLCQDSRENEAKLYRLERNWTEAGFACYREFREQFVSGNFDISDIPSGQHWIGIFRKETFKWGNNINQGEGFDCTAVTIDTMGKLQKLVRKCSSRLSLLCDRSTNDNTGANSPYRTISTTKYDSSTIPTSMHNYNTSRDLNVQWLVIGLIGGVVITLVIVSVTVVLLRYRKTKIEAGCVGNQAGGPNPDTNYDQLNPNRGGSPYTELRNNSVTYDYISTTDTNRDYLEIIEG